MSTTSIGKLPPRYSFFLNPYTDIRFSKCPLCEKLAAMRKFALFIYIDKCGRLMLGKTCRYCSRCELIIAHQDELEDELVNMFSRIKPEVIGNEYIVIGTVEKKTWEKGVKGDVIPSDELLEHVADFKKICHIEMQHRHWSL